MEKPSKLRKLFIIVLLIANIICGMDDSNNLEDHCSSFKDIKYYECSFLNPGDENKKCTLVNNECIINYKRCEDYKENNREICESIIPDEYPLNICIFEKNNCISKERECSDFKEGLESPDNCLVLQSKDDKKRCFFIIINAKNIIMNVKIMKKMFKKKYVSLISPKIHYFINALLRKENV